MNSLKLMYQIKELYRYIGIYLMKEKNSSKEFVLPTPTQIQIINYILEHDNEDIYQGDLEKNLILTRATLSGVLKTMEKNEIIKRTINEKDARIKKIVLNSEIKDIFLKCQNRMFYLENILVKDIKQEELATFLRVLNKMKENLDNERMINND